MSIFHTCVQLTRPVWAGHKNKETPQTCGGSNLRSEEDAGADDELEDVLEGLHRLEQEVVPRRVVHAVQVILEHHHQLAANTKSK